MSSIDALSPHWTAQLLRRLCFLAPLKAFGTMGFIALFFLAYFWLLRNPMSTVLVMPLTVVDHAVPFSAEFLPVYLSLWVYVSLPPALIGERAALHRYGVSAAVLCLLGLALFALWPTTLPANLVDGELHAELAFLQGLDVAGNACPSMHVASAVFSALWMQRLLGEVQAPSWLHVGNLLWCLAIVYSTLAVKQHVFIDLVCGLLLGLLVAIWSLRWEASRASVATHG